MSATLWCRSRLRSIASPSPVHRIPALQEVFLRPGEYFVGGAGWRMRTLLGSCVSIILWHPGRRVGAMSHFLLSTRGTSENDSPDGRYGDEALTLMLRDLERSHVPVQECEAKLFGGGNMFPRQLRKPSSRQPLNVGEANGQAARALLCARGIPVRSESLFGVGHRQVIFDVATGMVWARQVSPEELGPTTQDAT